MKINLALVASPMILGLPYKVFIGLATAVVSSFFFYESWHVPLGVMSIGLSVRLYRWIDPDLLQIFICYVRLSKAYLPKEVMTHEGNMSKISTLGKNNL